MAYHESDTSHAHVLARSRQPLSPLRQEEGRFRTFGLDAGPCTFVPPQGPNFAQLVSIRAGAALLHCDSVCVAATGTDAVWVPAGVGYFLELRTRSEVRILYADSRCSTRAFGPARLSALLIELIERAAVAGYLAPSNARDARLLAVIDDEVCALTRGDTANSVVLPRDPALLAAVNRALATLDDVPTIAALAASACMSVRTFERRFVRETGLAPRTWLRRMQLARAATSLAAGASVTEAALACGYSSTSAFVAAFRRRYGTTPGRAATRMPVRRA